MGAMSGLVKAKLIRITNDPAKVQNAYTLARAIHPPFPQDACAVTASVFLLMAGEPLVVAHLPAERLADELKRNRWIIVPDSEPPQAGDVFVCEDLNGNKLADHVGIVAGIGPTDQPGRFQAMDNQTAQFGWKPYLRNIGPGNKTPVDYWLRSPSS